MQKKINKILIIILIVSVVIITVSLAVLFRIKHLKNQNETSVPTNLMLESSVSSSVSSTPSSVSKLQSTVSKTESVSSKTESSVSSAVTSVPTVSVPRDNGIKLVISNPTNKTVTVTEPTFTFKGTSDIEKPLTLNGKNIDRKTDGSFSYTVSLNLGKNTFKFSHKGNTLTYTVTYRYVVIKSFTPAADQSYNSGTTFPVTVVARNNSTVKAQFCTHNITLTPQADAATKGADEFITYSGSFSLPNNNLKDLVYNPVTFTATYKGITESFKSGKITCKKPDYIKDSNPTVTPQGNNYIDVGSGIITEVTHYEAETFDAYSTNDWSKPTNSYLPKGTVDYSSTEYVYHKGDETKEYVVLRCGKQIYTKRKDKPNTTVFPVVKSYVGTLPDHNEIEIASFSNGTSHSTLTLNTLWKAPFTFKINPQSYYNPPKQDYRISQFTATHIDITFCYATVFKGEIVIPADNPLFSSAKIIPNYDKNGKVIDTTLRLNFKKTGGFYGWNAVYNDQNQLVFEFLNPSKVTAADNEYGVDLTGIKVLIDVGHGGKDIGALGFDYKNHSEAIQNLSFAKKLGSQLIKLGATVYLTREQDILSSTDDKIQKLKRIKPDICIAIHHNSGKNANASGFDSYYFTPFSMKAAYYVYKNTVPTNLYKEYNLGWHYYYVARNTVCPVVLTENGYISNKYDYQNIINDESNNIKVKAITKGIADYFLAIQ